jgi:Zn finger protein HypA/HybF involved in hydrogenase expression
MHEYTLAQELLDLVLEQAGSRRIVQVNVWIGPFSEEREESIHFFWKDLAKGSPGDGAMLHFDPIPPSMKCLDCSGAFLYDDEESGCLCEFCYGCHMDLLNGQEIQLKSIEFE